MPRKKLSSSNLAAYHALGAGVFVMLTLGWIFGLHRPQVQQIRAHRQELTQLIQLVDTRPAKAQQLIRTANEITELQRGIECRSKGVEQDPNVASLLGKLADLSKQTQCEILDVQPQTSRRDGSHWVQPLRCRIQADWVALCRFVDGLQRISLPVRVTSLQMSSLDSGALGSTQLELNLIYAPLNSELHQALTATPAENSL